MNDNDGGDSDGRNDVAGMISLQFKVEHASSIGRTAVLQSSSATTRRTRELLQSRTLNSKSVAPV